MERRKFITGGGAAGLLAAFFGTSNISGDDEIPEFKEGDVLTAKQLNRLIAEINRLKAK